jgi:hypothetical protein
MSHEPGLLDYVCANADKLALMLALEALAGLLSVGFFLASEPGTPVRVVSGLNVAGVVTIGGFTAILLWKCYQR